MQVYGLVVLNMQDTVKHLRWSVLQKKKKKCLSAEAQPDSFQGRASVAQYASITFPKFS